MLYRRKFLLALLYAVGGKIEKVRLQKILFLHSQYRKISLYDFVPYRYGCFSFTSYFDLNFLAKNGLIIEDEKYWKLNNQNELKDYEAFLKYEDKVLLKKICSEFNHLSTEELIRYVYQKYPYYASKSEIYSKITGKTLSTPMKDSQITTPNTPTLFTIGYEGISLEAYFNKLIQNDVKVLVDVRNNPISMKWGFHKSQLSSYCEKLGIEYLHFPELGIPSQQRKTLNSSKDYEILFQWYKAHVLPNTRESQRILLSLIREGKRIAITCFEANPSFCHRKHLAEYLKSYYQFGLNIKDI